MEGNRERNFHPGVSPGLGLEWNAMMKLCEGSYASSEEFRPTETIRSKRVSQCKYDGVRLPVINVPVRNCLTPGVQNPFKAFISYICRTWESYLFATPVAG